MVKNTLISITFILNTVLCFAITVSNSTQLSDALINAKSGDIITINDGYYYKSGGFKIPSGVNGTALSPITLRGSKNAILSCNSLASGYGLYLQGNNYWILDGFTVTKSSKGIVTDNSNYNILNNLDVINSGDEAIHLRKFSSYNTISNCFIDSTGSDASSATSGFAEGIYIGSAVSNWSTYTSGNPDTCNYNIITGNTFGDVILSENIDIKEGTSWGIVSKNSFNGKGCNSKNSADSWIDVKGNYYKIECNSGKNNYPTGDGLQTHIAVAGWGDYNSFSSNTLDVGASGYGININLSSSKGTATHNSVCDNNTVTNASKGMTNVSAISCSGTCTVITSVAEVFYENVVYPNPFENEITISNQFGEIEGIEIFDCQGKTLFLENNLVVQEYKKINTSALAFGLYHIKIYTLNSGFRFIKMIK